MQLQFTISPPYAPRFWSHVNRDGPIPDYAPHLGPCWLWTAGCTAKGYGRFNIGKRIRKMAHVVGYELVVGPMPEGLEPDHLCRVHACVRFSHIEPVTRHVNQLRGYGVLGINMRKTDCIRGHPLSGANLYVERSGGRHCRTCRGVRRAAVQPRQAPLTDTDCATLQRIDAITTVV